MRRTRAVVIAIIVLVSLLAVLREVGGAKDIPAGTGYAAWDLCSRTYQSKQDFELVRTRYVEPKVAPLPNTWSVSHQPGKRVLVESTIPTLRHPRAAIFRPGLGCTVLPPKTSEDELRAQPFTALPASAPSPAVAWPHGEGAAEPARLSAAGKRLIKRHAKTIFGETSEDLKLRQNTTALLVAQDGALVYERYGNGYTRDQPQLGWSMTKSLTAMIAGALARDGELSLDGPVGLPRWKGTPKERITWRHLLNMAPGLAWFEGYGGASDATEMLFSQADQGAWAADRPLTSEPGAIFTYSTGFSNIAMLRMRQLLGGSHQALYEYYQKRIFAPLGIRGGVIEPDASGTPVGGARGFLRPVDWLRLGQLIVDRGSWQGQQLLPREYVAYLTSPSPASPEYGGSLWLPAAKAVPKRTRSKLPQDLAFFAGHLGQFTVIVPSKRLVVVRMGVALRKRQGEDPVLGHTLELVASLAAKSEPAASRAGLSVPPPLP
ncbi:MAG: serine hydrolase [Myxococcales bacterium]|nr:serine hydrolase [Myxococcales bacterium]